MSPTCLEVCRCSTTVVVELPTSCNLQVNKILTKSTKYSIDVQADTPSCIMNHWSADWCLCLVIMWQPSRASKCKRPPEDISSSVSLEVVSLIQHSGCVTKKWIIMKMDFDPQALPIAFPNDKVLPISPTPGLQEDPFMLADNAFKEPPPDATSCLTLVNFLFVCHVIIHWPLPPRPSYKNGFHVAQSSSMNSFTWKLLYLKIYPALHAKLSGHNIFRAFISTNSTLLQKQLLTASQTFP